MKIKALAALCAEAKELTLCDAAPMHPAPELVTWLSDVLGGVTVNDG